VSARVAAACRPASASTRPPQARASAPARPISSRAAGQSRVHDGIAAVLDDATAAGVQLAVEPLHPMFCADRSVISTLQEANDLADRLPGVGVLVDAYHVWWDPRVHDEIARAGERILGFHVCDWILPLPEGALLGRGLPGDGCADLAALARSVAAAGYRGPIEVEVLNQAVWEMPGDEVLQRVLTWAAAEASIAAWPPQKSSSPATSPS
jgi:sugar phosphate isomerase/epimerase